MATVVNASVTLRSSLEAEALMEAIILDSLPNMFTKWGPFPGVVGVKYLDGEWQPGRRRTVFTSDGKQMSEEYVRSLPGETFAYHLTHLQGLFGFLVSEIDDLWYFSEISTGSVVGWTWKLRAKPGRGLPVRAFARLWRVYMGRILEPTLRRLESAAAS